MFPILKSSDNLFNHEIEISAWNAKKQRQITEREIELIREYKESMITDAVMGKININKKEQYN